MSCFRPNCITMHDGIMGRFAGRLTQSKIDSYVDSDFELVPVPCGKCVGCRLDKSKAWADRMLLEFYTPRDGVSKRALFFTMTYDDVHVPGIVCTDKQYRYNLEPRDPTLFLKRLRKAFPDIKIRYYLSGEYGDRTFRPHYHAIVYGLGLDSFPDAFLYSQSGDDGNPLYESPMLDKIWQVGALRFTVANYQTFCYVARYVIKKQFLSDAGSLFYKGRTLPFSRMSRRPGLGADYFSPEEFGNSVHLFDGEDVHEISTPRFLLEKLSLTNPELFDKIKEIRGLVAKSNMEFIDSSTDLSYLDYLALQESNYLQRTSRVQKREF